MFKFLVYSAILYTVYSYFARLGRIEKQARQQERRPPAQAQKYRDAEDVEYEEIK